MKRFLLSLVLIFSLSSLTITGLPSNHSVIQTNANGVGA